MAVWQFSHSQYMKILGETTLVLVATVLPLLRLSFKVYG